MKMELLQMASVPSIRGYKTTLYEPESSPQQKKICQYLDLEFHSIKHCEKEISVVYKLFSFRYFITAA
jgi:hypothetical protein